MKRKREEVERVVDRSEATRVKGDIHRFHWVTTDLPVLPEQNDRWGRLEWISEEKRRYMLSEERKNATPLTGYRRR